MGYPAFCIFIQYKKLSFPWMYCKINCSFNHPAYLIAMQTGCVDYPLCLYPALTCIYVPDFVIFHSRPCHFTVENKFYSISSAVFCLGIDQIKRIHNRLPWTIDCPQHSFCQFRLHCFSLVPAHEFHIIIAVGPCIIQSLFQYIHLKTIISRHNTSAGIMAYL